jgi:hypothetical protein
MRVDTQRNALWRLLRLIASEPSPDHQRESASALLASSGVLVALDASTHQ